MSRLRYRPGKFVLRMPRRWGQRARRLRRNLGYALLVTGGAFLLATGVLDLAERAGWIDTSATDELAFLGYSDGFAVERERDEVVFVNEEVQQSVRLAADKPADELRVVLLGGSMAMGVPYVGQGGAFDRGGVTDWMQAMLEASHPHLHPVVLNACAGGLDSLGVSERAKWIQALDPDVLIVLTGNNEGRCITRTTQLLHRWIVFRALRKLILGDPTPSDHPIHIEMTGEPSVLADQYEANIASVSRTCERSGIPLMLATMPIHYSWSGTVIDGVAKAYVDRDMGFPRSLDEHLELGLSRCEDGDVGGALDAFHGSPEIYLAQIASAQCLTDLGRSDEAWQVYHELIVQHPMGRAFPQLNERLRALARGDRNSHLVDVEAAYLRRRPDGLPDSTLWVDNCHMHWRGYGWVAELLVRALVSEGVVPAAGFGAPLAPSLDAIVRERGWTGLLADQHSFDPAHPMHRITRAYGVDGVRRGYHDMAVHSSYVVVGWLKDGLSDDEIRARIVDAAVRTGQQIELTEGAMEMYELAGASAELLQFLAEQGDDTASSTSD